MKSKWFITGLIPLVLLLLVLGWLLKNGTGVERDSAAPIEVLNIDQISIQPLGFELDVSNTGPEALTISQVIVDDSVWNFTMTPSSKLDIFLYNKILFN